MKTKIDKAFTLSLIGAIYFNTVLVILKELYQPVKHLLQVLLFHHWLGHGVLVIVFFLLCGWLFVRLRVNVKLQKMPWYTLSAIVINTIGISIFYLTHAH